MVAWSEGLVLYQPLSQGMAKVSTPFPRELALDVCCFRNEIVQVSVEVCSDIFEEPGAQFAGVARGIIVWPVRRVPHFHVIGRVVQVRWLSWYIFVDCPGEPLGRLWSLEKVVGFEGKGFGSVVDGGVGVGRVVGAVEGFIVVEGLEWQWLGPEVIIGSPCEAGSVLMVASMSISNCNAMAVSSSS